MTEPFYHWQHRLFGGFHMAGLIFAVAALGLAIFWVYQFVQLMLLEDHWFPGRYDKALWVGAFVLVFPVTPFAFLMWKAARRAEVAKRREE